jgi:hypothetical protein
MKRATARDATHASVDVGGLRYTLRAAAVTLANATLALRAEKDARAVLLVRDALKLVTTAEQELEAVTDDAARSAEAE